MATAKLEFLVNPSFTIKNNIIQHSDLNIPVSSTNLGQTVFESLKNDPDHVIQIEADTGKQTTFEEMKDRSVRCALWMKNLGIGPNDIIVVCTHNHLDAYIPVLATFYIEAIYNAWSYDVTLHSARHLMQLFKPKLIFACERALNLLFEASKLENVNTNFVVFGNHQSVPSLNNIMQQHDEDEIKKFTPRNSKGPEDVSAIFLSSGSTGLPKGVMTSGDALVKNMMLNTLSEESCIFLWYSSLYWISGTMLLLTSIFKKLTRILHGNEDTADICRIIEKYKIDSAFLSPVMLAQLSKSDDIERFDIKSLKKILTGGSKPSVRVIENLEKRIPTLKIYQGYGMTELARATIIQTGNRSNYDTLGYLTQNVEAKIVDVSTGKAMGPLKVGELCFKTPTMMLGYYKNPEATRQTIDQDGWLHTGDLCYYNEKSEFFIVDRLKEIMKFRNYQVSPLEIEEVLLSHSAVMEVGVVPIPHEIDGERPMAFVKIAPGKKVTEEELIKLSSVLGENKKLWGGVKFLEDLPKTPSGKIARSELKKQAKSFANTI